MIDLMAIAIAAHISANEPVYETTPIYETREETTCTKSDDKTTEGAILGGIIGAGDDKLIEGIIIGGILGDLAGEEVCETKTVTVQTGTVTTLIGWNVTIVGDNGKSYTVFLPA